MFVTEAPFFSNKESNAASFVEPLCSSMVAVCLAGLCVSAAEALSPLWGVSFHLLTLSSCCCCLVGHTGTQSPDWATLAWPCSIPPTTLITSQMVIDEASLAALTPLKDSQTYIRGATDRPELPPSKPDFTGSWGPGSLITPAVPHCCPAHRLHREDSSSRITSAIFSYACPQTQPKLHRRVKSIIQWLN